MIKHEIADLVPDIAKGWVFTDLIKSPPRLHMVAVTAKRIIVLTFLFLLLTTKTPLLQNHLLIIQVLHKINKQQKGNYYYIICGFILFFGSL